MGKMSWFKFWDEFLGDPKMLSLDDGMTVLWVKMLCLANRAEERGVIGPFPNKTALVKALYTDDAQLDSALTLFASDAYGMIAAREDGAIVLTNWEKRNPRKPSDAPHKAAERQRRSRAQKTRVVTRDVTPLSRACHAPVTRDNDTCHADVTRTSRLQDIRDKSTYNPPTPLGGEVFDNCPEQFVSFWQAYPNKRHKTAAFQAWERALKQGAAPDDLITAAKNYAHSVRDVPALKQKHPANFLNEAIWEEYVTGVPASDKPAGEAMPSGPYIPNAAETRRRQREQQEEAERAQRGEASG